MYVEYIEKPIEDIFLKQNGLLRHTDGTKEEIKKLIFSNFIQKRIINLVFITVFI